MKLLGARRDDSARRPGHPSLQPRRGPIPVGLDENAFGEEPRFG